ncbi:hypothetical protein [Cellulomonas sp.]|uniref:hypothetical protein n=1 Tax=Cellulomonas sp. TaxID=40001 RepID=UPI002586CBFC|nr:hypothetical protein [Cellulomonas sp.]MCR6687840.1 hypothetical protein [Cellulomonas sp.]
MDRARGAQVQRAEPAAVQHQVPLTGPDMVRSTVLLPRGHRQERPDAPAVQAQRERLVGVDGPQAVEHAPCVRPLAAREVGLDAQVGGRALPGRATRHPAQLLDLGRATCHSRPPCAARPTLGQLCEDRRVGLQREQRRPHHPRVVTAPLEPPPGAPGPLARGHRVTAQERALGAAELALRHLARQPLGREQRRRTRQRLVRDADQPGLEQHLAPVPQRGRPLGTRQAAGRTLHARESLRQPARAEVHVAQVVLGLEHEKVEARRTRPPRALLVVRARGDDVPALAVQRAAVEQRTAAVHGVRDVDLRDRRVERGQRVLLTAGPQRQQPAHPGHRGHDAGPRRRCTGRHQRVQPRERGLRPAPHLELALRELHERARPDPHHEPVVERAVVDPVELGERRDQPPARLARMALRVVRLRARDLDRDPVEHRRATCAARRCTGRGRAASRVHRRD